MSRGRIVHWMLEETGAPYEIKLLDFGKKEHKSAEYLKINPMGKIPAIVHRGTVITECAAICTYLVDAFPAKQLSPGLDDPKRGTYLRWMFFGAGCVDPAMIDKMLSRPPSSKAVANGYGTYEETVDVLETAITPGPFILGNQFSAADVFVGSQIGFGLMTKSLESRPVFQNYIARLSERPAHKRTIEQCTKLDEKLKKQSVG